METRTNSPSFALKTILIILLILIIIILVGTYLLGMNLTTHEIASMKILLLLVK
jgi:hypothetical protein